MKNILILSNTSDFHSDLLVRAAEARGYRCLRWNTDHERNVSDIDSDLPHDLVFRTGHKEMWSSDLDLVFIRRPLRSSSAQGAGWLAEMLDDEWHGFEQGLIHLSSARVVNPASASTAARNKLLQIKLASESGLAVPETLISTRRTTLAAFADGGPVITKAVSYGGVPDGEHIRTGHTRLVTKEEILALDERMTSPTLLQRRIPAAAMWRIVTIGERTFSFRLQGSALSEVADSRFVETQLQGGPVPTPAGVEAGLVAMCRQLAISYASSDFIEDADGRLWFLDLNPDGQWAHYELTFGVPLSEHLVDLPARRSRSAEIPPVAARRAVACPA